MTAVFRPYSESEALRSDRSAGDRKRHREKLRRSIRENIADVIAEESIIGRDRDRVIKVPIRGVKEYRFVYGDNAGGVGTGDGNTEPGQVVGSARGKGDKGQGPAGSDPGLDYYETEITLDELIDIMFEDLELPDLERKILKQAMADRIAKRQGYRKAGIRVHLDRRRTIKAKLRRKIAAGVPLTALEDNQDPGAEAPASFPFRKEDLTYKRLVLDEREESNAVVVCIMDTSGSMDRLKKYLARSFFFLLYQFLCTKYKAVEIVFIAHHTQAKEVTEEEFFHKGESGGTLISSGYKKALEVIQQRYHPGHWNIYAFHCSDGDNFESDNDEAMKAAKELCEICNLFGYGEIKPMGSHYYESSMLERFRRLDDDSDAGTGRDQPVAVQEGLPRQRPAGRELPDHGTGALRLAVEVPVVLGIQRARATCSEHHGAALSAQRAEMRGGVDAGGAPRDDHPITGDHGVCEVTGAVTAVGGAPAGTHDGHHRGRVFRKGPAHPQRTRSRVPEAGHPSRPRAVLWGDQGPAGSEPRRNDRLGGLHQEIGADEGTRTIDTALMTCPTRGTEHDRGARVDVHDPIVRSPARRR